MFFHNKVSLVICCRWMICAKAHPFRGTRFVFLKHVVAVRGKLSTSTNAIWTLLWFPLLRSAPLTLVLPVKGGGSTARSAKIGFSTQRDKENAPLPFGGRAMEEIKLQLVYFLDVRSQLCCPLCSVP